MDQLRDFQPIDRLKLMKNVRRNGWRGHSGGSTTLQEAPATADEYSTSSVNTNQTTPDSQLMTGDLCSSSKYKHNHKQGTSKIKCVINDR